MELLAEPGLQWESTAIGIVLSGVALFIFRLVMMYLDFRKRFSADSREVAVADAETKAKIDAINRTNEDEEFKQQYERERAEQDKRDAAWAINLEDRKQQIEALRSQMGQLIAQITKHAAECAMEKDSMSKEHRKQVEGLLRELAAKDATIAHEKTRNEFMEQEIGRLKGELKDCQNDKADSAGGIP